MAWFHSAGSSLLSRRTGAVVALSSVAVLVLVLASQATQGTGIVALDQIFKPHPPLSAPHESVEQSWAELAAHAPKAPQWLASAERRDSRPDQALADAAHSADPNFPVEAVSTAREQAPGQQQQQQQQQQAAQAPSHSPKPVHYQDSEGEWQSLRSKMYRAVHVFHKYGDLALEKLIPKKASQQQFHVAVAKAEKEVGALKAAAAEGGKDESKASDALKSVEHTLKLQERMKRAALKAEEDGKIAAAKDKVKDLERQLKESEARDARREKMIQKEVEALSKENGELRRKDTKVSMELEKVPAAGKREGKLAAMKQDMKKMQGEEGHDVAVLKKELATVEAKNRLLQHAVATSRYQLQQQQQQQQLQLQHQRKEEEEQQHQLTEQQHQLKEKEEQQQHQLKEKEEERRQMPVVDDIRRDDAREMMEDRQRHSLPSASSPAHLRAPSPSPASFHTSAPAQEGSLHWNKHLPLSGFANTDSSLGCEPCLVGPGCHAGCRLVKGHADGITLAQRRARQGSMLRQFSDAVPLGAKSHMPEGEEWGFGHKHCPAGGCDALEEDGVKVDGWGFGNDKKQVAGASRLIPSLFTDPASNTAVRREMNQRQGRFAVYDHSNEEGVYTPPVTWGANARFFGHDNSPGAQKLEKHGVLMDAWPNDIYNSVPVPMFDKSVWDHEKNQGFAPKDTLKFNRDSNRPMEKAGVRVNKWPSDEFEGEREMPTMDGMPDRMVDNEALPKYRKSGVAAVEKPLHFLLRSHTNLGAAQPSVDWKHGVETIDEAGMEGHKEGEPGFRTVQDSLGCGPQGCFD